VTECEKHVPYLALLQQHKSTRCNVHFCRAWTPLPVRDCVLANETCSNSSEHAKEVQDLISEVAAK